MVATIILVGVAFGWLFYETDFMRVRLPVGKAVSNKTMPIVNAETEVKPNPIDTPYYWMTPEQKEQHLVLCVGCRVKCQHHKSDRWASWKLPARTIKAFNSTLNLVEGCNIQRALFLKSMARELNQKATVTHSQPPLPMNAFISQERIGSHKQQYGMRGGRRHYEYTDDYETVYHDCLAPKSWLKKHEHDLADFEPTIELSVSGGVKANINGNYNKGVIKQWMKVH